MANTIDKVLKLAEEQTGYLEKASGNLDYLYDKTANAGDKNYTKYGKEMHDIYPSVMDYPAYWCDSFVDWCFYKAYGTCNAKGLLGGEFNDYTPASAQLYKNKGAWYTSNPKPGDQIFFKNSTRINHTGIVYDVDNKYVYTIEGNTSGGSDVVANGGGVFKKKYLLTNSRIAGYGRPKYDASESVSSTTNSSGDNLITSPIKTGQKRLTVSVEATLNVRDYPVTGDVVGVLHNGNVVTPSMKTVTEDGKTWFYLSDRNGWVSASYLTGWIQDDFGWWYLEKGYTWPSNCVKEIDNALYYFSSDGYLVRNNAVRIDGNITYFARSDGSLITNDWYEYNGNWYYCGEDGAVLKNSFMIDNKGRLFYMDEDGKMFTGELALSTNKDGVLEIVN